MRLYEYEGKELFKEFEIPVPKAEVVATGQEALQAAKKIGFPVVVKAQVQMGGRGKAGLILEAENEEELLLATKDIKSRIGADEKILIEDGVKALYEGYVGITVDDLSGVPVLAISAKGGMDVENVAETDPEAIAQVRIDPQLGLYYHQILGAVKKAGYKGEIVRVLTDLVDKVHKVFVNCEADTVEINPVLFSYDNGLVAGDAKVIIDDYSIYRNQRLQKYYQKRTNPENGTKAIYVPLDGDIGIVSFGASSTMMLIDSIKCLGGKPANFADITSGVDHDTVKELTSLILRQSEGKAKVVLINSMISGASLRVVIEGIVDAINTVGPKMPMVANVRASGAARIEMGIDKAAAELQKVGVLWCDTLEQAINTAIKM